MCMHEVCVCIVSLCVCMHEVCVCIVSLCMCACMCAWLGGEGGGQHLCTYMLEVMRKTFNEVGTVVCYMLKYSFIVQHFSKLLFITVHFKIKVGIGAS